MENDPLTPRPQTCDVGWDRARRGGRGGEAGGGRFPDSDSHRSLGYGRSQEQGVLAPDGEKQLPV